MYKVCHSTRWKLPPGKSNARIYNCFISQEKERKNHYKNVRETYYWKLIFVICSYSTWARRHEKHARHVGMWALKQARHVGTWAREHARHVGTRARKHARHVGTWAHKHARHVCMWARKARNLADSMFILIWVALLVTTPADTTTSYETYSDITRKS